MDHWPGHHHGRRRRTTQPELRFLGNIGLALFTLVVVLILSKIAVLSASRYCSVLPSGTLVAIALGNVDFTPISEASIFAFRSLSQWYAAL